MGLILNETHRILAYSDGVNLVGDNIGNINEENRNCNFSSKEVGLELSCEEAKCKSCQHRDLYVANKSFESVSPSKYLGTTVTNRNLI
jgi:hypothetical protein